MDNKKRCKWCNLKNPKYIEYHDNEWCKTNFNDNYLKTFTRDKIFYEVDKTTNDLSDNISSDLQKRGMKFVGSTIIYSYLQAIGVIYSHDKECYLYKTK